MAKRKIKKERIIVLLDGSNFYHRLKDRELNFKNLLEFNYKEFAKWLAEKRKIVACIYYVGLVRKEAGNPKSEKLASNQQRLFAYLKNQSWEIKTGYMMKHDKDYKEKGVDVKLAVDILDFAYQDKYDTAIIVSSDTDLIPAISRVRELKKKIEYIGFAHRPSFGMQRYANISRLLTKSDLEIFFKKNGGLS
ncbi:hypothetical protein COY29_02730 [Candidatus Woesebacteria bacterium CG_4_10_14_0_2_um_filter_39_14]|uniref:NYN domain-containing protein n=1 Tax=Candidatus Woesebacteria bacterium CG_4_10_14_0_2_um_filter_39_14 TaxID=1975054 RepID=A0A2M7TMV5_9BACT|nr:MAG: hypothetical protein COY29_02730 [Candidatus Woesebacteria bacterium CG_4_10_14_0_2_um_filter_39_14]